MRAAGQRYCDHCHAAAQRDWRAEQAELRGRLPEAVRRLVIQAGNLRAVCACPPGTGCPECSDRRRRAGELEEVARMIAPLARVAPF